MVITDRTALLHTEHTARARAILYEINQAINQSLIITACCSWYTRIISQLVHSRSVWWVGEWKYVLCASIFHLKVLKGDANLFTCESNELVVTRRSVGVVARMSWRYESAKLFTGTSVDEWTLAGTNGRRRAVYCIVYTWHDRCTQSQTVSQWHNVSTCLHSHTDVPYTVTDSDTVQCCHANSALMSNNSA